jgi:cytochrome c5
MRIRIIFLTTLLALLTVAFAMAQPRKKDSSASSVVTNSDADADAMRAEGEQRFRANCGRCHAAPQKFPPRMMATIVRHMRVRATITDQDMRLVLYYMTQ